MAADMAVTEVETAITRLGRITSDIKTKTSLFGTPQDTRANHDQLNALAKEGNDSVQMLRKQLQSLSSATSTANKSAVRKLSKGFQAQVTAFEQACSSMVASEKSAVELIRRTSTKLDASTPGGVTCNEDQLYAQAQVSVYNEDDLVRREEDIIKINHQLREIKAAYEEVGGLLEDQKDVVSTANDIAYDDAKSAINAVVEIANNTEAARENARDGLENVQQADKKTGYCTCTCCYLCTIM